MILVNKEHTEMICSLPEERGVIVVGNDWPVGVFAPRYVGQELLTLAMTEHWSDEFRIVEGNVKAIKIKEEDDRAWRMG